MPNEYTINEVFSLMFLVSCFQLAADSQPAIVSRY